MVFPLGLFFSKPLGTTDWANLDASGVHIVMVPWALAGTATLNQFAQRGLSVVLRMTGEDMSGTTPAAALTVLHQARAICNVIAVILGVEPDSPVLSLDYSSPDWRIARAQDHAAKLGLWLEGLAGHGVQLITPGWMQRGVAVESGGFAPGQISWARAVSSVYDKADGNGVHIYMFGWPGLSASRRNFSLGSPIDEFRFRACISYWQAVWHKPLWIDEANIDPHKGTKVDRMRACLGMARCLRDNPSVGGRVAFFCPFVSNGFGGSFDPGFIMDDPACYVEVKKFISE
jgi:hypothetical protein